MTGWNIRVVVHAEYAIRRELLEQTVIDHLFGPGAAFFGRLKNKIYRAVKVTVVS